MVLYLVVFQDVQIVLVEDLNMIIKKELIIVLVIEMMKILKIVIVLLQKKTLKEIHGKHDLNNLYLFYSLSVI
jgi:hypothetical protein